MTKLPITIDRLKELLSYDCKSGLFARHPSYSKSAWKSVVGTIDREGYVRIGLDKIVYRAHRLAWFYVHGIWPSGQIDHINGDKADNRIENLRDVSQTINQHNRKRANKSNACGILGVRKVKNKSGHWMARIGFDGKQIHLGTYKNNEQAQAAFLAAKEKFYPNVMTMKGFEVSQQRYEFEVMRELEQEQAQMMMEHDQYQAEQEALEPHQRDGYMENMVCMNEDRLKALRENGL